MSSPANETTDLVAAPMNVLAVIERAATNPDVDIDKMRALLEMHEHVLKRNAETAFNAAFAEMQSELPEITENGQIKIGEQVRSKYALFEDINDAVKPILQKHGFAVTFKTHTEAKSVTVTGILMHREGHRESTDMMLEADTSGSKNGVQSIGSSVSYAKRYVLSALLNITTRGEDDDGARGNIQRVSDDQVATLTALIEELGKEKEANTKAFCTYFRIEKVADLPASKYQDAVKALHKKRAAGK